MKIKKEYIILFAIIIGAGLYLYFHDTDRLNYELPTLAPLSRADIARIDISLPQNEPEGGPQNGTAPKLLVLEKKGGQWRITPGNYRADATQVQAMLTAAIDLSLTTLVSTSEDYTRYGLSPQDAISVSFSGKDGRILRAFELGRKTTTHNHTFIKLGNGPNVYHAIGRLPENFDKTVAKLRDKSVLAFDRPNIDKITITRNNTTTVFEKRPASSDNPGDETESTATVVEETALKETTLEATTRAKKPSVWIAAQGQEANDDGINNFLLDLASLNCTSFLPEEKAAELNDPARYTPVYSVTLTGASGDHTLTLFTKTNESDNNEEDVQGVSSYAESPFVLAKNKAENIIKKVTDFIADEPAP